MFGKLFRRSPLVATERAPGPLAEFAEYLARRVGGPVIDVGCSAAAYFADRPELAYVGLGERRSRPHPRAKFLATPIDSIRLPQDPKGIVLLHDLLERVPDPSSLLDDLSKTRSDTVLVSAYDRERVASGARRSLMELESLVRDHGLCPAFRGHTLGRDGKDLSLIVCHRATPSVAKPKVVAIMTAFNEADIVRLTIPRLIAQGVSVYLIDNWSEDRTLEVALEAGAMGAERHPSEGPSNTYDWHRLLSRVEELALSLGADWVVHHDADEVRMSPFEGTTLAEGIAIADAEGYNAIDFTVADFPPVDDSFEQFGDLDRCFPGFVFGNRPGHFVQVKGWKNTGVRVRLADGGGHDAAFEGRRVYPFKFLLRHYPIRSQAHGLRKILRDRQGRWNAEERARGWHHHYDSIAADHHFLRDPNELTPYLSDTHFAREFLIERLSGVGIPRTG